MPLNDIDFIDGLEQLLNDNTPDIDTDGLPQAAIDKIDANMADIRAKNKATAIAIVMEVKKYLTTSTWTISGGSGTSTAGAVSSISGTLIIT